MKNEKIAIAEEVVEKDNNQKNENEIDYSKSKAKQGVALSFCMLYFALIYGAKKYPKGTNARKSFFKACITTSTLLTIVIAFIVLAVCIVLLVLDLTGLIAQGTVNGIVDGVING